MTLRPSEQEGIACMADVLAIEEHPIPVELAINTYELLRRGASIKPDAPALSFFLKAEQHQKPRVWTYLDLMTSVNQAANLFRSLGIGREDVVAFVLPNLPETHFTIWGAEAAGRVAAFNPLLEGPALAELIAASKAQVLVTLAAFPGVDIWEKIAPYLNQIPNLKHVLRVRLSDHVLGAARLAAKGMEWQADRKIHGLAFGNGCVPKGVKLHDFNEALARQPGGCLMFSDLPGADDISSLFCTGGTTGLPKIAMRTHRNEVFNAWSAGRFLGNGVSSNKNVLCGLPLFHVNAMLVTGLLPFSQGAHVLLAGPLGYRTPGLLDRFWEVVQTHSIHSFSGVPTLYSTLLEKPIGNFKVDSLEFGLCGAAPMPQEVMRRFQQRTGIKILEGYGLTEATCVSSVNPPLGERRIGSIGVRIPHQKMKVVLLDEQGNFQRDCKVNEVGQIIISGPNVFKGYVNESHNRGLWVNCGDHRVWMNSGDLGRMDAEGYFYLTGRRKELIIRGGHNIDPKVIEDALHLHPDVLVAAAVGRPDSHAGELPIAYIQLKPGVTTSEESLLAFAQTQIPERAAIPKAVRIIDLMPLTGIGKIYKPELKRREVEHSVKHSLNENSLDVASVQAYEDKQFGMSVRVTLNQKQAEEEVKRVLGVLALHVECETLA